MPNITMLAPASTGASFRTRSRKSSEFSFRARQTVVIEATSGLLRRSDKDYRSSCSMKASIITPGASASPLPRRLLCATAS